MTLTRMPPCSSGSDTLMPVKPPIGSASSSTIAISMPALFGRSRMRDPDAMPQIVSRRRRTVLSATHPR